jgi:hypothetical protein
VRYTFFKKREMPFGFFVILARLAFKEFFKQKKAGSVLILPYCLHVLDETFLSA